MLNKQKSDDAILIECQQLQKENQIIQYKFKIAYLKTLLEKESVNRETYANVVVETKNNYTITHYDCYFK